MRRQWVLSHFAGAARPAQALDALGSVFRAPKEGLLLVARGLLLLGHPATIVRLTVSPSDV